MSMERHRCKLCSKSFMNGRALGGHMRSHLATFPLPTKKTELVENKFQVTESDSSSTRSEHEEEEKLGGFYVLRENPKKSVKGLLDPEFYEVGNNSSVVVQDRESETESTQNPTRKRSKRTSQRRRELFVAVAESSKKCKKVVVVGSTESATESNPASSVSDPSQDEEVARCLMMLSRDVWVVMKDEEKSVEDTTIDSAELKSTTRPATRVAKFKCMGCKKVFRTSRALAGHKASNRQCCGSNQENSPEFDEGQKIYECPFCYKVFGSGQALGGHKRSHLLGSSTTTTNNVASSNINPPNHVDKLGDTTSFVLDLNLPAPIEEDEDHDTQLNFARPLDNMVTTVIV